MTKQYFFTLSEAAAKLEISEHAVVDLAHQERLPICFKYKGEISAVGVHPPEGDTKQIGGIRFNGMLRAMQPPADDESLGGYAVLVAIVRADGLHYTTEQAGHGRRILPTPNDYGGYILSGYSVVGFAEDVNVPCGKWLFQADDLAKLTAEAAPSGPSADGIEGAGSLAGSTKTQATTPSPVLVKAIDASEAKEERQDRRLKACIDAGLPMCEKAALLRLPYGVGAVATCEGVTRQAFSTDVKAALKRRENARKEGVTLNRT